MPATDPAEIRAKLGLPPAPTTEPSEALLDEEERERRSVRAKLGLPVEPQEAAVPGDEGEPPAGVDPRREAAVERLERRKRAGEEQWKEIEAQQPGSVVGETLRGAGRGVAEAVGETAKAAGRGVLRAREIGMAGVEAAGAGLREEGERYQREGFKVAAPIGKAIEAMGRGIEDVGQKGQLAKYGIDPMREGPLKRGEAFPEDFWEGMRTQPLATLGLYGLENVGTLGATIAGTVAAGPAGGLGAGYLMESGAAYDEALREGAPKEQARQAAGMTGVVNMALEYLPAGKALRRVFKGAPAPLLRKVVEQALVEGGTESMQELNSILAASVTYAEDHEWGVEDLKRVGASGLIATVIGGGAGTVVETAGRRTRTQQEPQEVSDGQVRSSEQRQEVQREAEDQPGRRPRTVQRGAEDAQPDQERGVQARRQEAGREVLEREPAEGEVLFVEEDGGAMEHAGSAVSPEAISRQAGGTKFYRVSPGGEVTPLLGPEAVDVGVRPSEVKVRVSPNGEAVIEQGTANPRQQEALEQLRQPPPVEAAPQEGEQRLPEEAAAPGPEPKTESPSTPPIIQRAVTGIKKAAERSPFAETKEAGVAGKAKSYVFSGELQEDLTSFVKKYFAKEGNLPPSAWELKLQRDHNIGAHKKNIEFRLREISQLVRGYDGPLSKKQLERYLGDALRGNVPVRTGAETAQMDETQIRRIAEKRGLDEEVVRAEFERVAERPQAGLAAAPEFLPVIGKLRSDIDAATRSLRREGLLDDAAARELERSHGLYTHRSYEVQKMKPKKYLRRLEKTPLWNRAIELVAERSPELTPEQVKGVIREMVTEHADVTLPGNVPEGAVNRKTLFRRKSVEDLKRLLLGERRTIQAQAMDTLVGQTALLENHRFLTALREDGLGRYLFEVPEGKYHENIEKVFQPLAIEDKYGDPRLIFREATHRRYGPMTASGKPGGKPLHTSPEILAELEEAMPHPDNWPLWLQIWSMGNFTIKANLTVLSPTTTGRNYISNVLAAAANGYAPWGEGLRVARETVWGDIKNSSDEQLNQIYQRFVKLALMDQGADYGDLRRMARFADLMAQAEAEGDTPQVAMKKLVRKASQFYQHGDNFWKILGFAQERARQVRANPALEQQRPVNPLLAQDETISRADEEAAKVVRRVLQNYAELPRVARGLSANPVVAPFFSFTWAMYRNTKETMLQSVREIGSENPQTRKDGFKRLAGLTVALTLPEMLTGLMRYASNSDDEDDAALREFVYPWDRGSTLGIVVNRPGEYVYFNWGFMDYFSKLKEPVRLVLEASQGRRDIEEIRSDLLADYGEEVLFGALIDAARGTTAEGYRVWEENDTLGTKLDKSVEHLWRTGRPGVARNVANLEQAVKGEGNRKLWVELVALLGPRFTVVNVRDKLDGYGKGFSRELSNATVVYSDRSNSRDNPGSDKLLESYRRANDVRRRVVLDLRRKLDAAVISGIPSDEAENLLDDAGVGKKYLKMAWGGDFEPVNFRRGPGHWRAVEAELEAIAKKAEEQWREQIRSYQFMGRGTP